MPLIIILICSVINVAMLSATYFMRYDKLRRTNYQVHPLTPANWIVSSVVMIIFMMASGNFALMVVGSLSLIYQVIFLIKGMKKNRQLKNIQWRIMPEDYFLFAFAVAATVIYYFLDNLNLAAMVALAGSVLGEIPTLRKDFSAPHTDSVKLYLMVALRYTVAFGMLSNIDFVGLTNSLLWASFSLMEAAWLVYCQKRLPARAQQLVPETVEISDE